MDLKIWDLECVKSNNVEIVKTLLKDLRIDISQEMLEAASDLKTCEILSILLSAKSRINPQVINAGLRHAIWIAKNPTAVEEFIKHNIHPKNVWGTTMYYGILINCLPDPEVMKALLKSDKIEIDVVMINSMISKNKDVAELMTQHKSFTGDKLELLGPGG